MSETRVHTYYGHRARHGKSSIMIICPFCDTHTEAYTWSLAGSGKKCDGCGAIHYSSGMTEKRDKKPRKRAKSGRQHEKQN